MKTEKLTAYDKFILGKNKAIPEIDKMDCFIDAKEEIPKLSSEYVSYLREQLRRTEPSDEKVLTKEEFESRDLESERKERMWKALKGEGKVFTSGEVVKNIQFKKFGKILLCAYVIIMLCLALIVIVKTTTGDNYSTAGATDNPVKSNTKIEIMEDEESENSDDWFDRFCDSLK